MKYIKVREIEITRNNISARQFYTYCKKQLAKKGVVLDDWCDWDSFKDEDGVYDFHSKDKHLDWDEPKKESVIIEPYKQQMFLQDCYNFIMEYEEEFNWGYLYLVEWEKEDEQEEQKEAATEEISDDTVEDEESTIIIPATPEKGAYINKEYQNVTPRAFFSACDNLCRENGVELSKFGITYGSFSSNREVYYKDDINESKYTHKQYNTFVHYAGRCCIVMEWKDGNGQLHFNEIKEKKESEEQEMNETANKTWEHVPETEEERARRMEMIAAGMKAGLNARYGKEAQATWQERFDSRHGEQLETLIKEIDAGAQVAQLESEQPTIKEYLDAAGELQSMAAQAETEEEGESYMITAQQLIECAQALAAPQEAPKESQEETHQEEAPQVDFEPEKAVLRWYSDYNGRRYGTPWVGIYDHGEYSFMGVGAFIGNCDKGGALIVNNPRNGVIYAYGQKDHRGSNTEREFAIWNGHKFVSATRAGYESKTALYSSPISYVKDDVVQYVRQVVEGLR